jgi:hypothetical protein
VNYAWLAVSGALAVTWPLWQGELPANWGDWPLTVVVMVFSAFMVRLVFSEMGKRDVKFNETLQAQRDDHMKQIGEQRKEFTDAIKEVGQTIAKDLGSLQSAVVRAEKAIVKHDKGTKVAVKIIEGSARKHRK